MKRREFIAMASGSALVFPALARSALAVTLPRNATAETFADHIGICTHFFHSNTPYVKRFDALLEIAGDLGIRNFRDDAIISVGTDGSDPGYARIRKCVERGFAFSLIFYDACNPYSYTPPSAAQDVFSWCDNGVNMFEGSNEPSLVEAPWRLPLVSLEHQKNLHSAVKANPATRTIPVAGPSYIQENVKLALAQAAYCDFANVHAYAGMEHPETNGPGSLTRLCNASRRVFSDRRVVVTEIGYHTAQESASFHFPVSDAIKARYIPRSLLWAFMHDVERTYLYELASSFAPDPRNVETAFGLLDHQLRPTPAYYSVKSLLQLCRSRRTDTTSEVPATVVIEGDDSERHHVVLNRADGTQLVPVWLGLSGWQWPEGIEQAPVERSATFRVSGKHRRVRSHRFLDDGTVTTKTLVPSSGSYALSISDQVTLVDIQ